MAEMAEMAEITRMTRMAKVGQDGQGGQGGQRCACNMFRGVERPSCQGHVLKSMALYSGAFPTMAEHHGPGHGHARDSTGPGDQRRHPTRERAVERARSESARPFRAVRLSGYRYATDREPRPFPSEIRRRDRGPNVYVHTLEPEAMLATGVHRFGDAGVRQPSPGPLTACAAALRRAHFSVREATARPLSPVHRGW